MKIIFILLFFPLLSKANIRLTFVGDVMLADGPGRYIKQKKDPFLFVKKELQDSDFTIGNLECPVARTGVEYKEKPVTFRAEPDTLKSLTPYFQIMSLANNHSGDYGRDGFLETMKNLDSYNIKYVGGGKNLKESHTPYIINKNGIKIAILAYNEYKPRSFEAGDNWPGIAWSDDDQVEYDIKTAKKNGADIVIPFMHWGEEYIEKPNRRQILLAKKMIDAGADAIVGGHPHVTQMYSHYKSRPIIWSLGNFLFDGFPEGNRRIGWILKLNVEKAKVQIESITKVKQNDMGIPMPQSRLKEIEDYLSIN